MARALTYLLGASALVLAHASLAQQKASNWHVYKIANGLPQAVCTSVTIAPRGKVLVTHPDNLCSELDGYGIRVINFPQPLQHRVYESPGGQFWTVVSNGLVEFKTVLTNSTVEPRTNVWAKYIIPEIRAEFRSDLPHPIEPIPLCPVRQGLVLLLFPDHLLAFDCPAPNRSSLHVLKSASQTGLERLTGLTLAQDGGLWLSGSKGLAKVPGPIGTLTAGTKWQEFLPPPSLHLTGFEQPHQDRSGGISAVAESLSTHQRLAIQFDGKDWSAMPLGVEKLRLVWHGPNGGWWAATENTLLHAQEGETELTECDEITARFYYDVAIEPSGVFWLATSDGLFRFAPLPWSVPRALQRMNDPVQCLTGDAEDRVWFLAGNLLHSLRKDKHEGPFALPVRPTPRSQTRRALFPLKSGSVLLDAGGQVFEFHPDTHTYTTLIDRPEMGRVLGSVKDGIVAIQRFSPETLTYRLEAYDGVQSGLLPNAPPESSFGGELTSFYAAQNGDLWLGGQQGIAWSHEGKWQVFGAMDRESPRAPLHFIEIGNGKLWCVTQDKIWEFDGRTWMEIPKVFDRINSLVRMRDGTVWLAANNGLYRFYPPFGAWVESGTEEGLASSTVHDLCEDSSGHLWAATAQGLCVYDPNADRDPPLTRVQELTRTSLRVPEGGTISLSFQGQDKWQYNTNPRADRLLYSYQLDHQDWMPFSEANGVTFSDLPAGSHSLLVRAMDRNCNVEAKPVQFDFQVILPWFKEPRLLFIASAGVAGALFFAALAFNRHLRLLHSYAQVERIVAERTRELELANQELYHSQKMTALGTLAAGIAHDFNNILSIIQGSAQIIEDNLDNPGKVRTRVDRIKTVVGQGAGIVKAMLGFSRDSGALAAPCDLNSVAEDTLKLLGDRFLQDIRVTFEPAHELPPVLASKDLIQQILLNFIFNAAESMNLRRHIILSTRSLEQLPPAVVLAPAKGPAYVSISVRDFGCGIPPENLGRIFEPFFTTKALSTRRGTGLGLSMVYELAKKMEAGLAVESLVNQGSSFTLILPVPAPGPETRIEPGRPPKPNAAEPQL